MKFDIEREKCGDITIWRVPVGNGWIALFKCKKDEKIHVVEQDGVPQVFQALNSALTAATKAAKEL
jgi:hypothetical protein